MDFTEGVTLFVHHCNLMRRARALLSDWKADYRLYIMQKATEVQKFDDDSEVWKHVHKKCCQKRKLQCKVIDSDCELDIIREVMRMIKNPSYAVKVVQTVEKFAFYKSRFHEEPGDIPMYTKCQDALDALQNHALWLCAQHMCMSVWKYFLGLELTLLEAHLCEPEGVAALFGPLPCVSRPHYPTAVRTLDCYNNPALCRHCLQKIRRKPLVCMRCRSVYFCSKRCQVTKDALLGHAEHECTLLICTL